jgi:UDP-glucose 4-epimerase
MRCVVLGGGGFIGSHLIESLLLSGNEVSVFDRPEARYLEYSRRRGARVITGDFLSPEDLSRAVSNSDVVYHLVSATVPQTSNDDPVFDVHANVIGTLNLLNQVRKAQVKKIVFASSGGTVYGIPHEIPIKENHPTEPTSSYGICKLTIEKYLHLFWTLYGLDYCILRPSNAYGERQPVSATQGVISSFLNQALHDEELVVWGDGSVVRDYIYIGDIADALVRAATYDGVPKIFNIGAGQGHSLNDIIRIIEHIRQRPLRAKFTPGRVFDVPVNILDISLAKTYMSWHPTVGLQEGISRTFQWLLKQETG